MERVSRAGQYQATDAGVNQQTLTGGKPSYGSQRQVGSNGVDWHNRRKVHSQYVGDLGY